MTTTTIQYRAGSNLLNTLAMRQSGSIAKGITECIKNSMDSQSTSIQLTLSSQSFEIKDNGLGFSSEFEVDNYFKVLGFDHEVGKHASSARHSRFGLGRFQLMSFSPAVWRSGTFMMQTDSANNSGSFVKTTELPFIEGCTVYGDWYVVQTKSDLMRIEEEVRHLLQHVDMDITINGSPLDQSNDAWDYEDENVKIKFTHIDNPVDIYDKGVFIESVGNASLHGATVVSKEKMKLNTACDHVDKGKCSIWKLAQKALRDKASENIFHKPIASFSKPEAMTLLNDLLDGQYDHISDNLLRELSRKRIIFGAGNAAISCWDLLNNYGHLSIAKFDSSRMSAKEFRWVRNEYNLIAISADTLQQTNQRTLEDLYTKLNNLFRRLQIFSFSYSPSSVSFLNSDDVDNLYQQLRAEKKALDAAKQKEGNVMELLSKKAKIGLNLAKLRDFTVEPSAGSTDYTYRPSKEGYLTLGSDALEAIVQDGLASQVEMGIYAVASRCKTVVDPNLIDEDDAVNYENFHDLMIQGGSLTNGDVIRAYKHLSTLV